jgi:hypothetical protein
MMMMMMFKVVRMVILLPIYYSPYILIYLSIYPSQVAPT